MGRLAAEFVHEGVAITLVPEHSAGRVDLRVDFDGQEYTKITHQLAEFCLWMPVSLDAMRQTLIDYARTLASERSAGVSETGDLPSLASGDNFAYATVYRAE
ncbi:hypothetical protein NEK97_02490 [Paenarthrobacter sp. UW852]|uniref:hypothetical protein n=1 Tax=Paenarthrobacter sp. UW852 TaxID=2951989 RepID=UPI002148F482|nr:hypothetical protein [Paenarthrobacter sp. UW852]MCR1160329.1 hypothetical protein [Paenarthrobacter sp. UW852]